MLYNGMRAWNASTPDLGGVTIFGHGTRRLAGQVRCLGIGVDDEGKEMPSWVVLPVGQRHDRFTPGFPGLEGHAK